jgi:hypothetical protein
MYSKLVVYKTVVPYTECPIQDCQSWHLCTDELLVGYDHYDTFLIFRESGH